jgi:hypothetical protein
MYKITRKNDGKEMLSETFKFIDYDNNGRGKSLEENIEIDRALILPPYNEYYSWMTTQITEIIENNNDRIHFKTKNSEYLITKEDDDD